MRSLRAVAMFWICLVPVVVANSFFADFINGKGPYRQEEALRFIDKMNKLNRLQAKILDVDIAENDQIVNTTDADAAAEAKPDEIPYLFEGDMVLTDEQMDLIIQNAHDQLWAKKSDAGELLYALRGKRSMASQLAYRWSFPIPYYINTATGVNSNAVEAGIAKWESETCVRFTKLKNLPSYGNALEFILGSGCWSYIGKVGYSSQQISIGHGCTSLGTVTHEIGHALGFYHEQARYDRDNYVKIVTQNIMSSYLSQFSKQSYSAMVDYGVGYDYGSVMHYDQTAFTSNGGNTIASIDPNYQATLGQRSEPSFMDIKRINFAYCNSSCPYALSCENGGYTDPNNCNSCKCPTGFGGNLCQSAESSHPNCGSGDLTATDRVQSISASGNLKCSYVISVPAGAKVYFELASARFTRSVPCYSNYLEIKYGKDMSRVGARFCTSYPTISLSESNKLVVIYRGSGNSAFKLNYRIDPINFIKPTTSTSTTTTAAPAPSPTPAAPTPAPTQPAATTTQPIPTTTRKGNCSAWSKCSAQCGGCGTRFRRCGSYMETVYCNTSPCNGGYCCRPFFYVTSAGKGLCRRPQASEAQMEESSDEPVASEQHDEMSWKNIQDHPKARPAAANNKGFAISNNNSN